MSRMPGAAWVPLPRFSTTRMTAHDIVCIHTMVGSLMGTDAYFRSITSGVNSHYGTGGVGEPIRQWGDTAYRSGANLNGNGRVISIENADMGPGFGAWDTNNAAAVPPFTAEQAEDIAQILAWECSPAAHAACPPSWNCHREGIPFELIPDALPGRRGVGYHRQGVPGFMVPGAEKWSSSAGKVCPTDRRIGQLPSILARAKQIAAGAAPGATLEEQLMAQIKFAVTIGSPSTGPHKDKLLAFYRLSGRVYWLRTEAIAAKFKMWLERDGIPFREVGEIDLPEAFGDLSQLDA